MEQKTRQVRNIIFGQNIPQICVSIMGTTREEIVTQARAFLEHQADVAEWRVDDFLKDKDAEHMSREELEETIIPVLKILRIELKTVPLLFTFRTLKEGGECEITTQRYQQLQEIAISSSCIDLLDIQYMLGDQMCMQIVEKAHQYDIAVVLSYHDFEKTPPRQEMLERIFKMHSLGADFPKIAVMPRDMEDVLTTLSVSYEVNQKTEFLPIIIAMGKYGMISRTTGEIFGSVLTFAAGQKASAPGQISVSDLRDLLRLIHKNS